MRTKCLPAGTNTSPEERGKPWLLSLMKPVVGQDSGTVTPVGPCQCGGGPGDGARWGVLLLVTLYAVGCDCGDRDTHGGCDQRFVSGLVKNGTFTSPGYPNPYPSQLRCIYTFQGEPDERVQVLFVAFEMHQTQESTKDCEAEDAIMVFVYIKNMTKRLDNYCGSRLPPQMMSSSPTLTIEMRSYHSSPEVSGFRAIYRFVSNFGITAGRHESNEGCYFIFNSTERTNGTFTSPNWPGLYPRSTECHYLFFGSNPERVHITFAYFDVDGDPPCTEETASDYVEFSNFRTVDRKIPRHCGNRSPKVIESDGDFFRVTFKSNDKFDATGFEAFFQFRNFADPFTVKRVSVASADSSRLSLVHQMAALACLYSVLRILVFLI